MNKIVSSQKRTFEDISKSEMSEIENKKRCQETFAKPTCENPKMLNENVTASKSDEQLSTISTINTENQIQENLEKTVVVKEQDVHIPKYSISKTEEEIENETPSEFVICLGGEKYLLKRIDDEEEDSRSITTKERNSSMKTESETLTSCATQDQGSKEEIIKQDSEEGASKEDQLNDEEESDFYTQRESLQVESLHILEAFYTACGEVLTPDSVHVVDIIGNHMREKPLARSTLEAQANRLVKMMTSFALSLPKFNSLPKNDQLILLKNNAPLYVQYILARYFQAKDGLDQIMWLLEGQVRQSSIANPKSLQCISFAEYNSTVNFVPSSGNASLYLQQTSNVEVFFPLPPNCCGLLANAILYRTTSAMERQLLKPDRIFHNYQEAMIMISNGVRLLNRNVSNGFFGNFQPLIKTLNTMRDIVEGNFSSDGDY